MASEKSAASILKTSRFGRVASWTLASIVLINGVIAFFVSREPDMFWVNRSSNAESAVIGYSTTDTLIRVAETLLDKSGGYLTNDKLPPFVFLDNIPSWEAGVVNQMSDLGRVMRDDYTRSQSQSQEDGDVSEAARAFFHDPDSWILPTTESRYREGIGHMILYRERLMAGDPNTQFYARADNLREWLSQVEKRLGSVTRRLGNSVVENRINEDLAGDPAAEAAAVQPDSVDVRTPWLKIDNVFFEARGTAWALLHFFRAAEFDFANVLRDKNAEASVRQIIRELEASLEPVQSPMIMNGSGYGLFANHSLVMANYLARANAAVINLRELLDQG